MASSPKWTIEFDPAAQKELDGLDKPTARRISKFLYERVAKLDDHIRSANDCREH